MGDPAREADRPYTAGMAAVERVKVEVVSVAPPRLRIDVSGSLPDACTEIERVDERRLGSRIELSLPTRRPFGAECEPERTPFSRSIPLAVEGDFDFYVVDVNGVVHTVWVRREPRAPTRGRDPFE
jgi:inhibitor of cysteine peptidase